jgi:hypothetical protein
MRFGRLFCCFTILGAFALSLGQTTVLRDQIFTKAAPSVVLITTESPGGAAMFTGFIFGSNGLVVTTYGPISTATKATIILSDGQTAAVSGIIDFDGTRNVCLLKTKVVGRTPLVAAAGPEAKGAKVYTIGTTDGTHLKHFDGWIQAISSGVIKSFLVGGPASPYDLGAPVLNANGRVVAMIAFHGPDPSRVDTAVPVSYLTALNEALAVKPLGKGVAKQPTSARKIPTFTADELKELNLSEEDIENLWDLSQDIVDFGDFQYSVYEQAIINALPNSYKYGLSENFTNNQNLMNSEQAQLMSITFDDAAIEAARKDLINRITTLSSDMDSMATAVGLAILSGGWSQQASTLADNANNEALDIKGDGSIEALTKDSYFQGWLPAYYLELHGLKPDKTGFKLGAVSMVAAPLFLISVAPDGIGAKLNLSNLDEVEQFNGRTPKDMEDFKMMIKAARGKSVTLKVKPRFGDEREYQVTVPSNLH